MCGKESELQKSHIFPRSYFRKLKAGNGQLLKVVIDDDSQPEKSNLDPKEPLFCRACEQFLSEKYEQYGTRILTNRKFATVKKDYVEFRSFRYKDFYLYLISIIWRASISSLDTFKHISFPEKHNNFLKQCLLEGKIKINTTLKLDHFIKISVIRIIDSKNEIDDIVIRKTMMNLNFEKGSTSDVGMIYYFMADGFLVAYHFTGEEDIHKLRVEKNRAQLRNLPNIKIPRVDFRQLSQIRSAFSSVTNKISEYRA